MDENVKTTSEENESQKKMPEINPEDYEWYSPESANQMYIINEVGYLGDCDCMDYGTDIVVAFPEEKNEAVEFAMNQVMKYMQDLDQKECMYYMEDQEPHIHGRTVCSVDDKEHRNSPFDLEPLEKIKVPFSVYIGAHDDDYEEGYLWARTKFGEPFKMVNRINWRLD